MKEFDKQMTHTIKGMLENYEAEYTPQAWDKLNSSLDANLSANSPIKKWWWFGIIGFLLIAGFLIIRYSPSVSPEQSIQKNQSIQYKQTMKKNESSPLSIEDSSASLICSPSQEKQIDQISLPNKNKISSFVISSSLDSSEYLFFDRHDLEGICFLNTQPINHLLITDYATDQLEDISSSRFLIFETSQKQSRFKRKSKFRIELPQISLSTKNNKFYKKFLGPNKLIAYLNPEIHKSEMFKQSSISSGWGIEIEGPLSKQLSVSIGVAFQTNKLSQGVSIDELNQNMLIKNPADFTESEFEKLIPLGDSVMNRTAEYQLLEIPLTFKLYLLKSNKSNVNVRCGLSALFFLKETYNLPFLMGSELAPYQETKNYKAFENIQLFGSVNLGLGYQYQFTDRLALTTSFDYKLGLNKLGDVTGNLNRMSFQAGISYRFGRSD